MSSAHPSNRMTLEQYEQLQQDGERWIELVEGRLVRLAPPDDRHGDVVRNLARALAVYLRTASELNACFELPLIIHRDPATVRCPAISCFRVNEVNRFAETDKLMTETCPALIVEVASSNDRREAISNRVETYLDWGVEAVWVIDPITQLVHQFRGHSDSQMLKEPQVLLGQPVLFGFSIPVANLFRQPEWVTPDSIE